MKKKWVDEAGGKTDLGDLSNEKLLNDTQRLVDALRRRLDDKLLGDVLSDELTHSDAHQKLDELKFEGLLKDMVKECQKRGLALNTDR